MRYYNKRYCPNCNKRNCGCSAKSAFATETVNKVITIPKPGEKGDTGNRTVLLYTKTLKDAPAPTIAQVPNPSGWSRQIPTLAEDEQRWVVQGTLNADGTVLVEPWTTPAPDVSGIEPITPIFSNNISDI